jgi:hypothetical protein
VNIDPPSDREDENAQAAGCLADVRRFAGARVTSFSFKASGPRLASIFDGNEQLIAITSVPHYSRTIYLPAMRADARRWPGLSRA